MNCYCQSNMSFSECCEPFLTGQKKAPTAEKLMRARYSAYSTANIDFLKTTLAPESRHDFDPATTKRWAQSAKWKGLKIIATTKGLEADKTGTVEFIATYEQDGEGLDHHEVSQFRKSDAGEWFFVDGDAHTHREGEDHHHQHQKPQTVVRESAKIGRNDPCTCGSGRKYKKCCGAEAE